MSLASSTLSRSPIFTPHALTIRRWAGSVSVSPVCQVTRRSTNLSELNVPVDFDSKPGPEIKAESITSDVSSYIDIADIQKADQALRAKQKEALTPPVETLPVKVIVEPDVPETTPEPEALQVDHASFPLFEALPIDVRQRLPELSLDIHVYAQAPESRFILLNMKRYTEGETTREGLLLEEINSEGVVLSQGDIKFRLQTH